MKTEETITRIGRTFEVHESLGKRYIKCDRCEKQWNTVTDAAQCCAEPGEQKQVQKLKQNEAYWAKQKAKRAAGGVAPVKESETVAVETRKRKKPGRKPGQKKAAVKTTHWEHVTDHRVDATITVSAPDMLPDPVNDPLNTLLATIDARLATLTQARAALESFRTLLSGGAA